MVEDRNLSTRDPQDTESRTTQRATPASAIDGRPREILRSVFGYEHFRAPQEEVIATLMAGGDALVLMPTGGGKSEYRKNTPPPRSITTWRNRRSRRFTPPAPQTVHDSIARCGPHRRCLATFWPPAGFAADRTPGACTVRCTLGLSSG